MEERAVYLLHAEWWGDLSAWEVEDRLIDEISTVAWDLTCRRFGPKDGSLRGDRYCEVDGFWLFSWVGGFFGDEVQRAIRRAMADCQGRLKAGWLVPPSQVEDLFVEDLDSFLAELYPPPTFEDIHGVPEDDPSFLPDYYGPMLATDVDDAAGYADMGAGTTAENRGFLRDRFNAAAQWWRGDRSLNGDGVWVTNRDFAVEYGLSNVAPKRKGELVRDDVDVSELRSASVVDCHDGRWISGKRPSKRKSVK